MRLDKQLKRSWRRRISSTSRRCRRGEQAFSDFRDVASAECLEDRTLLAAGPAGLVKDINATSLGSDPNLLTNVNGTLFFVATDLGHGAALWKSNGTAAGTVLVADISPDPTATSISDLTNVSGTLYMVANDGIHGNQLWKSDGTPAGTVMVQDINPGGNSYAANLTNVNGTLFFTASDGIHGDELWKSDGTAAGTVMVDDINPGAAGSIPGASYGGPHLTNVNGTLYFQANDGTHGFELWKSDGTAAGTVMVDDLNPGSNSSGAYPAIALNGMLIFEATDGVHGEQLWITNGTAAGTTMLTDNVPAYSPGFRDFVTVNGEVFFAAYTSPSAEWQLWMTNGTAAGTLPAADAFPGFSATHVNNLTSVNGELFFWSSSTNGPDYLWKSDGTAAGTVQVANLTPTTPGAGGYPSAVAASNGLLFFGYEDQVLNNELWVSNGTAAGTAMVKDINSLPNQGSYPTDLTDVNGTLFFEANDGVHGPEVWKSDGTAAGTVMVDDIVSFTAGSDPSDLTNVNGTLFFWANDGTDGTQLWESNATSAGTVMLTSVKGGAGETPSPLLNANGTLFFAYSDGVHGEELWKTDGTAAGTVMVDDIDPGAAGSYPLLLGTVNGTVFFDANDGVHGSELWKSDGTPGGTVLVKDINPGPNSSVPIEYDAATVDDTLFFVANDGIYGAQLWASDGTAAGTVRLTSNVDPGGWPRYLTNVNGTLFFQDSTQEYGAQLWKSDGTVAGTVMVKDINSLPDPGLPGSYPGDLTNVNGTLFFVAEDGEGYQLWKSDGTATGTVHVYPNASYDSIPYGLTNVNGTLFFSARQLTGGNELTELWKTDGTAAGTMIVKDIAPGHLTNVNGVLYFDGSDSTSTDELWKSDGTAAGTVLVQVISLGANLAPPFNMTVVNGRLFFTAGDLTYGGELWALPHAAPDITIADGGPFKGAPDAATVTATNDAGAAINGSFAVTYYAGLFATGTPLPVAPVSVGQYTVVAAFTSSDPNYSDETSTVTFTISPATPTLAVTEPITTYTGNPLPVLATATGVGGAPVNGTFTETYYVGSTTGGTGSSAPPLTAGTYTVVANLTSEDPSYSNTQSAPFTFTINKAALNPWVPDPTFGTGGLVTAGLDSGTATTVQSNGKIIVVGTIGNQFAVARYNADGTLDTAFGSAQTGVVALTLGSQSIAYGVALDSNGDLVVVGSAYFGTYQDVVVARFTPNGTLDATFGSGGLVTALFGTNDTFDFGLAVAVQSDNEIVVAGLADIAGIQRVALARYLSNGTLDPTFGSGGVVETVIGSDSQALSVAIDPDGSTNPANENIIVGGYAIDAATGDENAVVARYDASGNLDPTFGTGGIFENALGGDSEVDGVAVQPDGKVVATGYNDTEFFVLRFNQSNTSGSVLDPTFNAQGAVPGEFIAPGSEGDVVLIQPDGKIVVAGDNLVPTGDARTNATVVRLNSDGTLDTTFDPAGTGMITTTIAGSTASSFFGLALEPDGELVAAGRSDSSPGHALLLERYEAAPTVSDAGGTYNGTPYTASGNVAGVNGVPATALEGVGLTFTYYAGSTATGTPLPGTPTTAGTYTVVGSFPGSLDYAAASNSTTFTITQAQPTVAVSDPSGTFTGNSYSATGTVTGVNGVPVSTLEGVALTFTYYAGGTATGTPLAGAPTSFGTYTVVAAFGGSTDYSGASVQTTFTIGQAMPAVAVTDAGGTYTGSPFAANATVAAVNGTPGSTLEGVGLTFTYYAGGTATGTPLAGAPTNFGTYTVVAAFGGSTDYSGGSAQTTFTIGQATPKVAVTDAGGAYTGSPYSANATVDGVNGTPGSTLEGVGLTFTYYAGSTATGTPLAGAPTNFGTYTVAAAFAGSTDYIGGSAQTTFTIGHATPKVAVTDASGTYTGNSFSANSTVSGINGTPGSTLEGVGLTVTYYAGSTATGTPLAGAPTIAGTYTVVAAFAGSADYVSGSAQTTLTIGQATPKVAVTDTGGTYTGSPDSATATVAGISGTPASTLEGVGLTVTYYAGGTATGTPLTGAPTSFGTYTVLAAFGGSTDYSGGSAQTTFAIGQATPKVAVTDAGGMYTGSPYTATATVAGVSGTPGSTLEGVGLTLTYYAGNTATGTPLSGAPTNAGTDTVVAAFTGSTDYSGNSAQTMFTISLATPKVVATDAGGQFTGNPFPATATATGIGGVSVGGIFTYTYYVGSTASGTGSATAPSAAGTYTVVAAFTSTTVNYANAPSGPVTFTITPASQSVTAPASASVSENISLVFSSANGNAISVADVNAGSASEQLSLSITNGTLTLASTKGLTITSGKNGSASMTFKGTLANLNAALNGLIFTPTTSFAGSASLAIAYKNLSNSKTATANVAVTVAVPASQPTVAIKTMLPTVVPGQPVPLALIVSDTNSVAQSATFTYSMAFGDGATASFSGANQLLVNHVFTHTGTFTISVKATDEYGHTSTAATAVINVVAAAVEIDPFSSTKTALYVGGTSGNDTVNFAVSGSSNIAVTLNGVSEGVYSTSGPLIIFGQGGKDADKEGSGLKNTVDLLESPNADSAETDLDKEAIQWAGLSAAVKILNE